VLSIATKYKRVDIIELLLDKGADIKQVDKDGNDAYHVTQYTSSHIAE